jgi:hypothetical protein
MYSPLPLISFISLSPIQETLSTAIFLPFTFMCAQYLHDIHPLIPLPQLLPLHTGIISPRQNLFHPSVLQLCKRKEKEIIFLFA